MTRHQSSSRFGNVLHVRRKALGWLEQSSSQAVLGEFERAALASCVALSLFRQDGETLGYLTEQMPTPLSLFPALRDVLSELGWPRPLLLSMEQFFSDYASIVPFMLELAACRQLPREHSVDFELSMVRLLETANSIMGQLSPELEAANTSKPQLAPDPRMTNVIVSVIAGRSKPNGQDAHRLPDWYYRRHTRRHMLNARGVLSYMGQSERVVVTNISASGLGLASAPSCVVDTVACITLDFGRSLIGSIRWKNANGAGFEFIEPLPLRDPMLSDH